MTNTMKDVPLFVWRRKILEELKMSDGQTYSFWEERTREEGSNITHCYLPFPYRSDSAGDMFSVYGYLCKL